MGRESTFEKILREKISSLAGEDGAGDNKTNGESRKVGSGRPIEEVVFELFSKIGGPRFFGRAGGYENAKSGKSEQSSRKNSNPHEPISSKVFKRTEPPTAPVPRQKRAWLSAQLKALEVLRAFDKSLDEYSTDTEIKTAYRKLAKKLHPDATVHLSVAERKSREAAFREIIEAYEKLSA